MLQAGGGLAASPVVEDSEAPALSAPAAGGGRGRLQAAAAGFGRGRRQAAASVGGGRRPPPSNRQRSAAGSQQLPLQHQQACSKSVVEEAPASPIGRCSSISQLQHLPSAAIGWQQSAAFRSPLPSAAWAMAVTGQWLWSLALQLP